jgi:hypothetical protein
MYSNTFHVQALIDMDGEAVCSTHKIYSLDQGQQFISIQGHVITF